MNAKDLYQMEKISDRVVLIVCTTYENPISYLPVIEESLGSIDFSGRIIFDLLLANGCSPNRFVEADMNMDRIDRRSMRVVDVFELDEIIVSKAHEFYVTNPNLVKNNHILLDDEKYNLLDSSNVVVKSSQT